MTKRMQFAIMTYFVGCECERDLKFNLYMLLVYFR